MYEVIYFYRYEALAKIMLITLIDKYLRGNFIYCLIRLDTLEYDNRLQVIDL